MREAFWKRTFYAAAFVVLVSHQAMLTLTELFGKALGADPQGALSHRAGDLIDLLQGAAMASFFSSLVLGFAILGWLLPKRPMPIWLRQLFIIFGGLLLSVTSMNLFFSMYLHAGWFGSQLLWQVIVFLVDACLIGTVIVTDHVSMSSHRRHVLVYLFLALVCGLLAFLCQILLVRAETAAGGSLLFMPWLMLLFSTFIYVRHVLQPVLARHPAHLSLRLVPGVLTALLLSRLIDGTAEVAVAARSQFAIFDLVMFLFALMLAAALTQPRQSSWQNV